MSSMMRSRSSAVKPTAVCSLVQFHHTGLRPHDHQAVPGDAVAGRTQSVAIQAGADPAPVGERQQGGSVPGFLDAGPIGIKVLQLLTPLQFRLLLKRLGNQGHQTFNNGATAAHHQLQHPVQVGGIAEGGIHHGMQVRRGIFPDLLEAVLGCQGPVDVSQQGVDLTVVAQHAHGLGQGPAGQGVGAEPPVVDRVGNGKALVLQVPVENRQHLGAHHALVDHRAGAQGGKGDMATHLRPQYVTKPGANAAAATKQQALQRFLVPMALVDGEEPLLNHRTTGRSHGTQHIPVNGHHPPAMAAETQSGRLLLAKPAGGGAGLPVPGQKHHAQGGNVPIRQRRYGRPEGLQQGPGNGAKHTGPVSGVPVTATAAPVFHTGQPPQGLPQEPVARPAVQPGQKPDATAVPLSFQPIGTGGVLVRPVGTGGWCGH